jgi:hypothetical protein
MIKMIFVSIFIVHFLSSCSQQSDGFAPSSLAPEANVNSNKNINYKNGETLITQSGWEATLDTTDPVERQSTSNGWVVEVKYE